MDCFILFDIGSHGLTYVYMVACLAYVVSRGFQSRLTNVRTPLLTDSINEPSLVRENSH